MGARKKTHYDRFWGLRFRVREWLARSWLVIPGFYVIGALALGLIVPDLASNSDDSLLGTLSTESARDILQAVASGMIAFTGLVVSVAVVVVQFGAGQYTPRLVLRFRRDLVVKNALGIFIAPALFALISLVDIKDKGNDSATLTVLVAVVLLIAAVIAFFSLTARLLDLLRPRRLYFLLREGAEHAIDQVYPHLLEDDIKVPENPRGAKAMILHQGKDGVLSAIDMPSLIAEATASGSVIEVNFRIGGYIWDGSPAANVFGGRGIDEMKVQRALIIAEERTVTQDPAFAIRAIVDIAIRALSPAVNDPTTGAQALDVLESLLHRLSFRELGMGYIHDAEGNLRVIHHAPGWKDLIDLALTEIRHYGAGSHQVERRLKSLLLGLLESCPASRRPEVESHLALLEAVVEQNHASPAERALADTADHTGLGGQHRLSNLK